LSGKRRRSNLWRVKKRIMSIAARGARTVAFVAVAVSAAVVVSLSARPPLRAALLAELNDPAKLPALDADPRIHFEPPARACAETAARILPAAIAKIEDEHGRPFSKAPLIGVYADFTAYARANGLGEPDVAGVSRAGRAILSPRLCSSESYRLAGVLTHELSHVHLFGWRPRKAPRPPQWFTEGLAVMASDGGGAESVSDAQAAQAIRDGYGVILDATPWSDFLAIPFSAEPPCSAGCNLRSLRQRLAYRQAALFVAWLRKTDAAGFSRLMRGLEKGEIFDEAFRGAFGAAPGERWSDFAASLQASR
jgi:hypothetical protein